MTIHQRGDAFDILLPLRAGTGARINRNRQFEWLGNDVPRRDYDSITLASRGLLLEGGRTNSITNSEAVGAVVGTPGTPPSGGWDISASVGSSLSNEIVATGTEDGIPYLDVRFYGTNSLGGPAACVLRTSPQNSIIVAQNQVWTGSFYCTMIAGSIPAGVTFQSYLYEAISTGGVSAGGGGGASFVPVTGERLINSRRSYTRTMADASTVRLFQQLRIAVPNGVAIDFTLRFGLPQLELGGFASSPIKTTSAAAARAADNCQVATSALPVFNHAEGTVYAEFSLNGLSDAGTTYPISLWRDSNNFIGIRESGLVGVAGTDLFVRSGAVQQVDSNSHPVTVGTVHRFAFRYKHNDFAFARDGRPLIGPLTGSVPSDLTWFRLGTAGSHMRLVNAVYVPRGLVDADLTQLVTVGAAEFFGA